MQVIARTSRHGQRLSSSVGLPAPRQPRSIVEPLTPLQLYPEGYVPPHLDGNRKTAEPGPMGSGGEPEAVSGAGT